MLYNIGDKVRINPHIEEGAYYSMNGNKTKGDIVNEDMMNYTGLVATITEVRQSGYGYRIDLDNGLWTWTDQMFLFEILSPFQSWENNIRV